jgi:heterodisulfide reductase subunit A
VKEANIGIFICDCGDQISSFLDLDRVEERVKGFPGVQFAKRVRYACNRNGLEVIRNAIVEGGVERILVAGCTARTVGHLFKGACEAAGLSNDRFELVDIREGCAWVHRSDPEAARLKAEDLIRMGVARLALSSPCPEVRTRIEPTALVIGGGLAGMTAALCLAEAKIPVKLVEWGSALGGMLQEAHTLYPEGGSASEYLSDKIEAVTSHPYIEVLLEKQISEITGSVGRYSVVVNGRRPGIMARCRSKRAPSSSLQGRESPSHVVSTDMTESASSPKCS